MDASTAFATVGNLASIGSIGLWLFDYLRTRKGTGGPISAAEFLRYLEEIGQKAVAEKLKSDSAAFSEIHVALEEAKDAVVASIATHDANDDRRHRQLIDILKLNSPRLDVRCYQGFHYPPGQFSRPGACMQFDLVNLSNCSATIRKAVVDIMNHGVLEEMSLQVGSTITKPPLFPVSTERPLIVPPNGGSASCVAYRYGNGPLPEFLSLKVWLVQNDQRHRYALGSSPLLREIDFDEDQ